MLLEPRANAIYERSGLGYGHGRYYKRTENFKYSIEKVLQLLYLLSKLFLTRI